MMDLLEDLSDAQRRAVTFGGGSLLIEAGPGAGKTRTLTRRIAHLVRARGVDPASIAAVTFTHRAAGEMRGRLEALLAPGEVSRLFIGTFHALGLKWVRQEACLLGFDHEPALLDETEAEALLYEVLDAAQKGCGRTAKERLAAEREGRINRNLPMAGEVAGFDLEEIEIRYTRAKRAEGVVDFNDLLLLPLALFEQDVRASERAPAEFRHLFVDEYQDVNALQVRLLRCLARGAESLTAIGDPNQAIYGFRGSDVRHFMDFPKEFAGAEAVRLDANYRSTVTIQCASDQLIGRGGGANSSEGAAGAGAGILLDRRVLDSDRAEAAFVARRIETLAGGLGRFGLEGGPGRSTARALEDEADRGFGDFAVLYRLNAQAGPLAQALEKAGIPFQQVGRRGQGSDPAARAILAAMRLAASSGGASSARRAIARAAERRRAAGAMDLSSLKAPFSCAPEGVLRAAAARLSALLPDRAGEFAAAAGRLEERARFERLPPEAYLSCAALLEREDPFDARGEKVTLSTFHAAKGLEFPVVFITGLEEGLTPYLRGDEEDPRAAEEEERRLLYVAMTRAKSELYLLGARRRFLFGRRLEGEPSPFLADISGDLLHFVRERAAGASKKQKGKGEGGQRTLF